MLPASSPVGLHAIGQECIADADSALRLGNPGVALSGACPRRPPSPHPGPTVITEATPPEPPKRIPLAYAIVRDGLVNAAPVSGATRRLTGVR